MKTASPEPTRAPGRRNYAIKPGILSDSLPVYMVFSARFAKEFRWQPARKHGGFSHGQNTRAKGLVPLDGKGWITGAVPKPVAIHGRKAHGVPAGNPCENPAGCPVGFASQ